MAQLTKGHLIGDLDNFCREVGLERFRERLDEDPLREREDKLVLTRDSDDSAFQRPGANVMIRRYQKLKQDILHRLADRHARGAKRVTAAEVFEGLCGAPDLINRALNELTEQGLIRELNAPGGMRLTAAGQASAETSLEPEAPQPVVRRDAAFAYDYFVSYASEDRVLAEQLHNALTQRGYQVWRDRGQLTLGDSLTEKISEGLAGSRYGIVILSAAFLAKNWPQAELQALQARAIAKGEKVILPILRGLSHEQLAQRLPLLADKLTISFNDNLDAIVDEIDRATQGNSGLTRP